MKFGIDVFAQQGISDHQIRQLIEFSSTDPEVEAGAGTGYVRMSESRLAFFGLVKKPLQSMLPLILPSLSGSIHLLAVRA